MTLLHRIAMRIGGYLDSSSGAADRSSVSTTVYMRYAAQQKPGYVVCSKHAWQQQ